MRIIFYKGLVFFLSITITLSCNQETNKKVSFSQTTLIKYAKGFEIEQKEDYKIITISNPWRGENTTYQYILYKNQPPKGYGNAVYVKTPINRIACMSMPHIAFIEKLGKENTIKAISGCNHVNSKKVNKLIADNKVKEIGQEQAINYEVLVNESVDMVMAYGINEKSTKYIEKLRELGQTVILNAGYMEDHPLGKLEWIKFVAAFYELDNEAINIFNEIEKSYLELVSLADTLKDRPTVFTGMPWNGAWYVAGAKSFQVQLFKDAGAKYIWLDNEEHSSIIKAKEGKSVV